MVGGDTTRTMSTAEAGASTVAGNVAAGAYATAPTQVGTLTSFTCGALDAANSKLLAAAASGTPDVDPYCHVKNTNALISGCTTTMDGSGSQASNTANQNCCLLTFATGLVTQTGGNAGGNLVNSNTQYCYGRGRDVRPTTDANDFIGDTFCALAGAGAFTAIPKTSDSTGTIAVAAGTVTACSCLPTAAAAAASTSASSFLVGFSLLAILASLWK